MTRPVSIQIIDHPHVCSVEMVLLRVIYVLSFSYIISMIWHEIITMCLENNLQIFKFIKTLSSH